MPGGLLNIIAFGSSNIILNGNPSKTFFKTTYAKYTNFGIQKFRIDQNSNQNLDLINDSIFVFKMPRHAELLMESYLSITLPDIWSTIIPPSLINDFWKPYHFKWVEHLGTTMIKNIRIMIGTQLIQEYTGDYMRCMVERDFSDEQKKQFDYMSGNVTELHSPENYGGNRDNKYPNSFFTLNIDGPEPSIRGRKLYIPLCAWFMNHSKLAFPLVSLQYNEITIEVTLRPLKELFTINNMLSSEKDLQNLIDNNYVYNTLKTNFYQRIQPDFTNERHSMYRFLQPPPTISLNISDYENTIITWNADVHIIANYGFLTPEESKVFALNEQKYLIKDVKTTLFQNIVGSKKVKLETNALVSNWMWFYRRSDVYKRNQWTNYTNWETSVIPYSLTDAPTQSSYTIGSSLNPVDGDVVFTIGPGNDIIDNGSSYMSTGHSHTPLFNIQNKKFILNTFSIIIDGKIRETDFDAGVYQYVEKYNSTKSSSELGIYNYNFCLDTSNYIQPTGAINLSRFRNIELEMTTLTPEIDASYESLVLCDENGGVIGVTKEEPLYVYTYDMYLFEERYNILRIVSGNGGLIFAR